MSWEDKMMKAASDLESHPKIEGVSISRCLYWGVNLPYGIMALRKHWDNAHVETWFLVRVPLKITASSTTR